MSNTSNVSEELVREMCELYANGDPDDYPSPSGIREIIEAIALRLKAEGMREAGCYAERLAVTLWEKHYKHDAPHWKPLSGDLIGILTQIDNMTTGLAPPAPEMENARFRTALKNIAKQQTTYELEGDDGDFEESHDAIIKVARDALLPEIK